MGQQGLGQQGLGQQGLGQQGLGQQGLGQQGLGRPGAGSGFGAAAGAPAGSKIAALFAAALDRHRAGALVEAEQLYRQILQLAPGHADAESRLGAVLMAQGRIGEAIPRLERAGALKPDLFEAFGNLAQAYLAAGQSAPALLAAHRALELHETAPGKTLFARCARNARFTADDKGRMRKALLRALSEDWAPPRELTTVCIDLIKLDRAAKACIAKVDAAWPARLAAAELLAPRN